jgi:hypothetical protein
MIRACLGLIITQDWNYESHKRRKMSWLDQARSSQEELCSKQLIRLQLVFRHSITLWQWLQLLRRIFYWWHKTLMTIPGNIWRWNKFESTQDLNRSRILPVNITEPPAKPWQNEERATVWRSVCVCQLQQHLGLARNLSFNTPPPTHQSYNHNADVVLPLTPSVCHICS